MLLEDAHGLDGVDGLVVLRVLDSTIEIASTARLAKNSDSRPKIFDESVVRPMLKATSRPSSLVLTASWSLMNLMDSFIAMR